MDLNDSRAFTDLLVAYKRAWITIQVRDAMQRNPASNRETVWDWAEQSASEGLEPVFQAVCDSSDVLTALRQALSTLALPDLRKDQ
jgi:hypothetical protein